MPIQIYRNFHLQKLKKLQAKHANIVHISAENINCAYSLEPPGRCGSKEYPTIYVFEQKKENVYPCKPQFCYIKMGFKGVNVIQAYFRDD